MFSKYTSFQYTQNKFFLILLAEEEAPLNLSIKANDVSSTIGRKSEIWSPGTVCEREAKETRVPSSRSPSSTPVITRPIHHSPLTPPSSSERTFQVSSLCQSSFFSVKSYRNKTGRIFLRKKQARVINCFTSFFSSFSF